MAPLLMSTIIQVSRSVKAALLLSLKVFISFENGINLIWKKKSLS